jgi:hypothetical protein
VLHVNPHELPSHVAVAFAGGVQAVHEVAPQVAVLLLDAQLLPQAWKKALQVKPHIVPLQVATPLAGTAHGVQEAPQVAVLVLMAQLLPQA